MTATCDCKFNDITNNNVIKENAILDNVMGEILDLIKVLFKNIIHKNIFYYYLNIFLS